MDVRALAELHRAEWESRGTADVRNIGPSIRDFERYVTTDRAELSVIGELRRIDPDYALRAGRGSAPDPERRARGMTDAAAFARAVEAGGAYGVSVCVEPFFGGSLDDLRSVSAATSLPVLARGIVLDEQDLYRLRDAGADAAVLHAVLHDTARISALWKVARSMRMELLVEVQDEASLGLALASDAHVIGVSGIDSDLAVARTLLERIPKGRTPVLSGGARSVEDLRWLLPHVDAAILIEPFFGVASPEAVSALVEPFTQAV